MLNISKIKITHKVKPEQYSSFRRFNNKSRQQVLIRLLTITFFVTLITLFIPWTQNVRSDGNVTALRPDQRPQTIHSVIGGRIEKWYVQEGDFVEQGDTILFISEVKDEYFDPNLLSRTEQQLKSKELAVNAYMEKVKAKDNQIDALAQTSRLKAQQAENKIRQAELKVISDSIDLEAAITDLDIAKLQFDRMESLYEQGLKSLTDLEQRKLKLQKALADKISAENKLLTSRNEVLNTYVELTSIEAQYRDDIAKAESEKYAALSSMYDAEAVVTKLQNQYMNYSVRTGMYYIVAPQDGYITKAIQSGLGETIKQGEAIISIMPSNYQLAVEMYVRPIDLPLINKGQNVRIQFDGWPAVIFSGWPGTSFGTYGGQVVAIDNFMSDNGMYRLLVSPDPDDNPWPNALRVGAGTKGMLLLQDVPIWYELWRKINGFPPDYYESSNQDQKQKSK